jgi:hypothetical protein
MMEIHKSADWIVDCFRVLKKKKSNKIWIAIWLFKMIEAGGSKLIS